MKLSDKMLIIIVFFLTIFILTSFFIIRIPFQQTLFFAGIIYVVSFAATYVISRRFSKRVVDLTFKVEEMAAGNFSRKLKSGSRDEIGQLVNALNELTSRLKTGVAIDVSKHHELAQAKTDFVSVASHELRTPLSIIKWYIDYLLMGDAGKFSEEQKKYLQKISYSNERIIDLVNSLLLVSRIDLGTFSIEPRPTDIAEIAEESLKHFLPEMEKKKIKFTKKIENIPILNLDSSLMKTVFENLISNAVKYTSEEGKVELIIKETKNDVLIKISDTGCGIQREDKPKIFTKFFRSDVARKIESVGTGLGLYIAKEIVEKSGGKIWFESPNMDSILEKERAGKSLPEKENQGTAIYITIPLQGMKALKGAKKKERIKNK
ncbi:MAG: HAMP domain-containing sensor histidine kinase [bacterium]